MTSGLLTLPKRDIPWSAPEEPLFVGKDILELLSSSMYVDPLSMYREYVQNSADSIDAARSAGVLELAGHVEIRLDHATRSVFIRDNGAGLGKETFVKQLTALGGSRKRGTQARGFRGVGRLAGLAFCQELIFRSRQEGEDFVHELRWDSRRVRSLLRSADETTDLNHTVMSSVQSREIPGRSWPSRFFEVELRGIVRYRDDRLLNEDQITSYLSQVAPVPFSPEFIFGSEIESFLQSNGIPIGCIEIKLVGRGNIYRPHKNSLLLGKAQTKFCELEKVITPGRDGGHAAVSWILHHDYLGALPSGSLVDGWRLRCGDIQIGDKDLLQACFQESRFNSWTVAETHVIDPRILPNGRRDQFEQNAYYFDLVNHLTPHARNIGQRCRTSSIARNAAKSCELGIAECQQSIRILEKGNISNVEKAASKLAAKINGNLDKVHRFASKPGISVQQREIYQAQVDRLRNRVSKISDSRESNLSEFSADQRLVLKEVFAAIYQSCENVHNAQHLVDKILARLKRGRHSRKS